MLWRIGEVCFALVLVMFVAGEAAAQQSVPASSDVELEMADGADLAAVPSSRGQARDLVSIIIRDDLVVIFDGGDLLGISTRNDLLMAVEAASDLLALLRNNDLLLVFDRDDLIVVSTLADDDIPWAHLAELAALRPFNDLLRPGSTFEELSTSFDHDDLLGPSDLDDELLPYRFLAELLLRQPDHDLLDLAEHRDLAEICPTDDLVVVEELGDLLELVDVMRRSRDAR